MDRFDEAIVLPAREMDCQLTKRFSVALLAVLCGWLLLSVPVQAQVTEQWRVDVPQMSTATFWGFDAAGNAYGLQPVWEIVSGQYRYTLHVHKVSSDGSLEWSVTDTPVAFRDFTIRENWPFWVDMSGNSYVVGSAWMDTVDGGDWPCVVKFSPTGSLLYQKVAQPSGCVGGPGSNIGNVTAWAVDPLGRIFAAGTLALAAGVNGSHGYAMILSPDAIKTSESFFDGGSASNNIWSHQGANGPRGPDMNGNYLAGFGQWEIVDDTVDLYARHLVSYDRDVGVRWYRSSTLSPTPQPLYNSSNFRMVASGNIYNHWPTGTLEKYSSDFTLQWTKTYATSMYERAENPFDESVLIYEDGATDPLACYNADGSLRWRADLPAPGFWLTTFGPEHDIYTVAGYTNPAVLMRIDYQTGEVVWEAEVNIGTLYGSVGHKLRVDADGAITFAGQDRVTKFTQEKFLTIRDAHNDSLPNVEFDLIKVTNNPPWFDEDTLGTFTTDAQGRLKMTPFALDSFLVELNLNGDTLTIGDSLKIARHVHSMPSVKHQGTLGTMYSAYLDNAHFAEDGHMFFDTLTSGDQVITLKHSELRYNLLVSVEWEATSYYLLDLEDNISRMSNYLYDVSDGQIRLDTVVIYDAKEQWDEADMRIHANNTLIPYCDGVAGIAYDASSDRHIHMPRIWWYNPDATRNHTDAVYPLDLSTVSVDYRSKAHELGHYALGFYDEYLLWDPDSNDYVANDARRCLPPANFNYGFMDRQYERNGVMSSEMSGAFRYDLAACRNTNQWGILQKSCWDHLETLVESLRWGPDNLFMPILKPDDADSAERIVTNPAVYFPGPNNNIANLDYDVGITVHFRHTPSAQAPGYSNKQVTVHHSTGGDNAKLQLWNNPLAGPPTEVLINQGSSSDAAGAWVVGVNDASNKILAYKGNNQGTVTRLLGFAAGREVSTDWLFGIAESGRSGVSKVGNSYTVSADGDSIAIELNEVQGYYPLIISAAVGENAVTYRSVISQAFSADPALDMWPLHGGTFNYTCAVSGDGYETVIPDSPGSGGSFILWAMDDSPASFFVAAGYTVSIISHDEPFIWLFGQAGQSEFKLDSMNTTLTRALIVSSPYPVIRTGLNQNAVQAGQAHCLSVYPDDPLTGSNQIVIHYNDADLRLGDLLLGDEASLAVYHWLDGSSGWTVIGGTVDTANNAIYASVSEAGVYAAFTVDILTDIEYEPRGEVLPYRFELSQNHPNPFNPATVIEYSLPERSHVVIEVFNVLGQKVRTLVDRDDPAGSYTTAWDGTDASGKAVATGVYLYRFQTDRHAITRKMLLLK